MQQSIPGHVLTSKSEPVKSLAEAFDLFRFLANTCKLLQICLRAPEETFALSRVEQFNHLANQLLYTFTLAGDALTTGNVHDQLAARHTSPVRFRNVSSTSYASLARDVAFAHVEVVEGYWREMHSGKIVHATLNPQYTFVTQQVAEIHRRFESQSTFRFSGTANEQLEAIRASFDEVIVGLRQEQAWATASGIAFASGGEEAEATEVPSASPQFNGKVKDGIVAGESSFPYEYGSDLHLLWGWEKRLRSLLSDERLPSTLDWMLFRPDRSARNAMMRFSIEYPHVIKQIDDYLDFANARFDEFVNDDTDSTRARFVGAMVSLRDRIRVGVKIIAQSEGATGQSGPTAGSQLSSRSDEPTGSEGTNGDDLNLERGNQGQRVRGQVFISYCHKDGRWLDDLQTHLKPFLRDGLITAWSDQQIAVGSKWFSEIQTALTQARVAVLLVTPAFLASDFIHDHELTPILKEAERGGMRIVWIPVEACAFKKTPLGDYQTLIPPERPLATMKKPQRDEAWVRICQEIETAAEKA